SGLIFVTSKPDALVASRDEGLRLGHTENKARSPQGSCGGRVTRFAQLLTVVTQHGMIGSRGRRNQRLQLAEQRALVAGKWVAKLVSHGLLRQSGARCWRRLVG